MNTTGNNRARIPDRTTGDLLQWVACGLLFLLFAALAAAVMTGQTVAVDGAVRSWIYNGRTPALTSFFLGVTSFGNAATVASVCLLLLVLPWTRKKIGIPLACCALATVALYGILKLSFQRPRPDDIVALVHASGYSFPSGHSFNVLADYGMLLFLLLKNIKSRSARLVSGLLLPTLILLIGISRIYLGVHYPSDVLGGWTLAGALLLLYTWLWQVYYRSGIFQARFPSL